MGGWEISGENCMALKKGERWDEFQNSIILLCVCELEGQCVGEGLLSI